MKTGKKYYFRLKVQAFGVLMAGTTSGDLKTKNEIQDMLFLRRSTAEDTLCCEGHFLK